MLAQRYRELVEAQNIANGAWYPTTAVPELVPQPGAGHAMPPSYDATMSVEQWRKQYIDGANKASSEAFTGQIDSFRQRLGSNCFQSPGVPRIHLTYGDDYQVVQMTRTYRMADGESVSVNDLMELPGYIAERVKADPGGHVFEKMCLVMLSTFSMTKDDPLVANSVEWADRIAGLRQILENNLGSIIQSEVQKLLDYMKNVPKAPVTSAFYQPALLGAPILNFFAPPVEWMERRDETTMQILITQRRTEFYRSLEAGRPVLVSPPPSQ